MFTLLYIAGEDAAHTEFVRGFVVAYGFPPGRINANPSRRPRVTGEIGDGRERMFLDASAAIKDLKSNGAQSRVVVLLHDLGREEPQRLRQAILTRVATEANIEVDWLIQRSVVLMPGPETEGWIAELLGETYRPTNNEHKKRLGRQAYRVGRRVGEVCRQGNRDTLPEQVRLFATKSCAMWAGSGLSKRLYPRHSVVTGRSRTHPRG